MRTLALAVCVVLVGSAAASAVTDRAIHGHGLWAEAELYAGVLDTGGRPIQILDQLCRTPETRQQCSPALAALRRAVSNAVDRRIVWVHHRRPHQGTFWVLAPIRWTPKTAGLRYAWDEPGPVGCVGGGQLRYHRERGSWKLTWGIAYEGCSASATRWSA